MKFCFIQGVLLIPFIFFSSVFCVAGWNYDSERVDVDIITSDRGVLQQYRVPSNEPDINRSYIVARDNERYRIRIRNRTNDRIGLVIAVDGRNILSGKKSHLTSREKMYVLKPHKRQEYDGWRTGRDQINRFYFTGMSDSYAADRNDFSAMGVIAVAVYREKKQEIRVGQEDRNKSKKNMTVRHKSTAEMNAIKNIPIGKGSTARMGSVTLKSAKQSEEAGTGFGESKHSPSRTVQFIAEQNPLVKTFIKYEWRSTLCRRGIIRCDQENNGNRFWPDDGSNDGYVPFPSQGYKR
jgi:hypothetical protein